ncbi:ORC-CDC6 family AAA ATPase [Plebeiibacterium sediminum]|uniref:Uncharacterized protein n=1 Tax=Plebeiibacterium sediminum TaxID=2992112 RepID=A0AAE3M703_9BACT|nr:hypothetical protein [Plebeiobacterium sediminum]MCW3788181.1 hypothetical protein [Plebeiobacterium sediminum]
MIPLINKFKGCDKENPFKDSQAKNFSNKKLMTEFCPTSFFWSLFNDQHEVLVGTRGSGKTILLRMMQYSLLRHIIHPEAKRIVSSRRYFALYVPTNIEFLRTINPSDLSYKSRTEFFQFGFNCFLAQTFLTEIYSVLQDIRTDFIEQSKLELSLAKKISRMWFPDMQPCATFKELKFQLGSMYHNFNFHKETDLSSVPLVFSKPIGTPIQSVSGHIYQDLEMEEEPKWLLCIDEADFLDEDHLKCINTLFRTYSQNIVIKMATLPFRHITRETSIEGEYAEPNGNDFNYRSIAFQPDGEDFKKITNQLCENRINKVLTGEVLTGVSLEGLIGFEGGDHLIDYYKKEIDNTEITREEIELGIVNQFSEKRKSQALKNGIGSGKNLKPVYNKFAPIYFLREMYKKNSIGANVAGFYAGPNMIRKVSEGNPRIFLQIMNQIFEEGMKTRLTPKKQTQILQKYANQHVEITERLPERGKDLAEILEKICSYIKQRTHNDALSDVGNDFLLEENEINNKQLVKALELGCAYSRLKVDENSLISEISTKTVFTLSNLYALMYWIPMRNGGNTLIWNKEKSQQVNVKSYKLDNLQTSFKFE